MATREATARGHSLRSLCEVTPSVTLRSLSEVTPEVTLRSLCEVTPEVTLRGRSVRSFLWSP